MIRIAAALWLAIAAVVAAALFHMKSEVQRLEQELRQVQSQVQREQEAVHILRAEWSYLNRPDRIADLARRHLQLAPLSIAQKAGLGDLSPPPLGATEREIADRAAPMPGATLASMEGGE
jgi:cell division protein FtsL